MIGRLELNWVGKYDPQNKIDPEQRILLENPEYSYSAVPQGQLTLSDNKATTDNMLIHGDNLLALKSLQQEYAGRISAIVIDPPYNSQNAFTHYDDNLEHSMWLNLMKPRLELLRALLADNGSIWICIDDDESHYLKVLCDEVFGRINFVANVIWEKKYSPQNDAKWLSDSHDHILVYAKNKMIWRPNLLPRSDEMNARYKNSDNDPRGPWKSSDMSVKTYNANCDYPITTPSGRVVYPPASRCWAYNKERLAELIADNRISFGDNGDGVPRFKLFLSEVKQGAVSKTIWFRSDVGDNQEAKKEVKSFNSQSVFDTPKPERLIERILTLATKEGDIVLDSFLGSGTTAAVAHKMNRRWIGIELGEHAYTHCYPRLKAVVDGEQGGISKNVGWQSGGGFKFYELAPSLLQIDKYGNYIISKEYNAEMLAAAMAKHEGYTYAPDENVIWKQGFSGDSNYIFTTTGTVTPQYLDYIGSELQSDEYLLICAKSFDKACISQYKNITIQQIPKALMGRCEWGKEDYSLNVSPLTHVDNTEDE